MLSEFQNYLKDEVYSRLNELNEDEIDISQFSQEEKNLKLLEIATEMLAENGLPFRCQTGQVDEGAGQAKLRLDGYFIDEDTSDLYVYTSHFDDECVSKITQKQIYTYMRQALRFVENSIRQLITTSANLSKTCGYAEEIYKAYKSDAFNRVIISVITNQVSSLAGETIQDKSNDKLGLDYRYEVYDSERLEKIGSQEAQRSDIFIDMESELGRPLDCLEVLPKRGEYDTYLSIFPGDLIYTLFDKYGQNLFEFNVRSFLQARSKVNRGIKNTLEKEPEMFLAYNNGLVVTVDEINVEFLSSRSVIKTIRGLQIVNGAQTTSSIYAAKKKFKNSLDKVAVPVKITQVSEDKLSEFVPLISQYANSQNNIQVADLSANHPFHIKIENFSRSTWTPGEQSLWFFERTRGSYEAEMMQAASTAKQRRDFQKKFPKTQKFTKTDMAKYIVCWDLRRPFQVALGNQKNFGMFMQSFDEVFGKDWRPDRNFYKRVVAINILFKAVRKAYMQQTRGFPAPVTAYTVSLLSKCFGDDLSLETIWDQQGISFELENKVRDLVLEVNSVFLSSAGDRNPGEWAKREECWRVIQDKVSMPDLSGVKEFMADQEGSEEAESIEGIDPVSSVEDQVRNMTSMELASIALWGRNGKLNKWEIGCLNTVADYAAENWLKKPTEKQLRHIARALSVFNSESKTERED